MKITWKLNQFTSKLGFKKHRHIIRKRSLEKKGKKKTIGEKHKTGKHSANCSYRQKERKKHIQNRILNVNH